MTYWKEILIAAVLVGLVTWAVASQLTGPQTEETTPPLARVLEVGEALSPDVSLLDLEGRLVRLGDRLGSRATVLYSWSTTCPCIPICDHDIRPLQERFGEDEGVRWIAICGEPTDVPLRIRALLEKLGARYALLRDPTHRLCGTLGFDRAAMIVVLDGDGYVRFRGNLTDNLTKPTTNHLEAVLPAVTAGHGSPLGELDIAYGCPFSDPLPDCPDAELAETFRPGAP